MHDDVTKMGVILKTAREAKGMTQAALSKEIGTVPRTIMDIENDKRHPTYEVFFKILRALELSADQIFWPEKMQYAPEQEMLIRAVSSCNERDKAIFMETAWAFIRAAGNDKDPE
jgi:DNA-binding XRE family transcriptional regulator